MTATVLDPRCQSPSSPPFTVTLNQDSDDVTTLFPASYRTAGDDIVAPDDDSRMSACVAQELDLSRLRRVQDWLWLAGRPMPPRPLHYQLILNRDIFVTERMEMHLVWTTGRIFVKPLPEYLLEPKFWTQFLCCQSSCINDDSEDMCIHVQHYKTALGFLFSYAALILSPSDYQIALAKSLIPPTLRWSDWRLLVKQLDTEFIYPNVDPRFHYGELRLSRLNKMHYCWHTPLRNYMSHWNQYSSFFAENLAWLASATVYIALVLTAMQLGVGLDKLKDNRTFVSASYGLTVFSILGPIVFVGMMIAVFTLFFVQNWFATKHFKAKRFHKIHAAKAL